MARAKCRGGRLLGGIGAAAAAALGGIASPAFEAQAQDLMPLLVVERASLAEMLPSDKDRALVEAMSMLPDRLAELPEQWPMLPGDMIGPISASLRLLERPGRLAIGYSPAAGGVFGYGALISVDAGDERFAGEIESLVSELMDRTGLDLPMQPSETYRGMTELRLPFGLVTFGPRRVEDTWRYDAVVGDPTVMESSFDALPDPEPGMTTVLRGTLDFRALTPGAEFAMQMAGGTGPDDQAGRMIEFFEQMGMLGENAMSIEFQFGFDDDESLAVTKLVGAREHADALGLPAGTLTPRDLRAIPSDAVFASIARADLSTIQDTIDSLREEGIEVDGALDRFREMTGVDLEQDLLATLGGTVGIYMSDSTGGGGLLSSVAIISYKDRDRFLRAHERLVAFVHGFIESAAPAPLNRSIRIERWAREGIELHSVRFNGLPVPFELSYAATRQWLIVGATPQAVIAAAHQAQGRGDGGILSVPGVVEALGERRDFSVLSYTDAARLARDGYPLVSMLGSAIANAMRSPDSARDPGMIVPTYHDLLIEAKPYVEYTYWAGQDIVTRTHSDPSLLVQSAALGGVAAKIAPVIGAGVVLPAMGAMRATMRDFGMADSPEQALALVLDGLYLDPFERVAMLALLAESITQQ